MGNKRYNVQFEFRELSASHYRHFASVEAANLGLAINRAWAEVKKNQHVKGRRLSEGKITFTVEKGED